MKRLRLIAVRSQQEEILRELMLLGCVEITRPDAEALEEFGEVHCAGSEKLASYKNSRSRIANALRYLDKYAPEKKALLAPQPEASAAELLDESRLEICLAAADEIQKLDEQVRRISTEESRERAFIESLIPWSASDLPLDVRETEYCMVLYGTLPAVTELSTAQAVLGEEAEEAELFEISQDGTTRFVLLVCARDCADKAAAALRTVGWSAVNPEARPGTVNKNIAAGQKRLEELAAEKAVCESRLADCGEKRDALKLCADVLETAICREENAAKLLGTESTFAFEGWVPAPCERKLAEILDRYDCAWETEEPDPEHPEEVPVRLQNNALTKPFTLVTEMYSLPAYNGLDPNPFIMPFFALFFGIMFADMAYGLILLIGGLLIRFKAKPKDGTMKYFEGLLIECGISTTVIGFLTGGFFGDAVAQIGSWFGKEWSIVPHLGTLNIAGTAIDLPLDLLSGNNPLYVLILAICLGAVHLLVGVGIGMYLKIRDGEWVDAILNDFCWWVMIAGLGLMVLGKGTAVLWTGVAMMVLGSVLTNKGFGKVTGIFSAVYNGATGYLGDFLSYSRLMALMLAGSVIASVFNQLGGLGNANGVTVGGTILFIIVFAIGHALNFGLNLIGCFVHTLRLQFLEFFGKWYRDGGRKFRPLALEPKYYALKEEKTE